MAGQSPVPDLPVLTSTMSVGAKESWSFIELRSSGSFSAARYYKFLSSFPPQTSPGDLSHARHCIRHMG